MNAKGIVRQFRLKEWAELVKERVASGQTVKSFCEEHGIHQSTYYHRQKRVREAAIKTIAGSQMRNYIPHSSIESRLPSTNTQDYPSIPQGWAEISELGTNSTDMEEYMVVEVGEFKVKVTHNTNPELFIKTCQMLVQLC